MIELNAALYVVTLLFYILKVKTFNLGTLLLSIYALVSIFSVFYYHHHDYNTASVALKIKDFTPFVYLYLVLMIFFLPILRLEDLKKKSYLLPSYKKFKIVSWIAIVTSVITIIVIIPIVQKGMSGDISLNRDELMEEGLKISSNQFIQTIMSIAHGLEKVSLVLFFYSIVFFRKSNLKYFLAIPAIIYPLMVALANIARGPLLFLILSLGYMFLMFRDVLSIKIKKILSVSFIVLISTFALFFIVITIARFGDDKIDTLNYFIYRYCGESFVNFNGLYVNIKDIMYGDNCFPYFRKLLGLDFRTSLSLHRVEAEKVTGVPVWIFNTFVGDLCIDFGLLGTFLISILVSFFSSKLLLSKKVKTIQYYIALTFLYSVFIEGIFVFTPQGNNQGIIITILVFLYFRYNFSNKSSRVKILHNE
nr:O-antigen polymerase [uncultured Flavobacterium sp.]